MIARFVVYSSSCVSQLKNWGEITHQLFLLGCGAQMLKYASPPMAQAWCQVMLDTRGGVRLSEQIQNDLLLRATGSVCKRIRLMRRWFRLTK